MLDIMLYTGETMRVSVAPGTAEPNSTAELVLMSARNERAADTDKGSKATFGNRTCNACSAQDNGNDG